MDVFLFTAESNVLKTFRCTTVVIMACRWRFSNFDQRRLICFTVSFPDEITKYARPDLIGRFDCLRWSFLTCQSGKILILLTS